MVGSDVVRNSGRLVVLTDRGSRVVDIGPRPVVLGREPGSSDAEQAITLTDQGVSRRHCLIAPSPEGLRLRDLDSTNGVFLNDRRAEGATLQPFDRIRVGECLLLFLDRGTDADKVLGLLQHPDETSLLPLKRVPKLEDQLLALLLGVSDLASQGEPLLDALLNELGEVLPRSRIHLLLFDHDQVGVAQSRGGPLGSDPQEFAPLLLEAHDRGPVRRPPAGDAGEVVCLSVRHRSLVGRRASVSEVRGGLVLELPPGKELPPRCVELLQALARQLASQLSTARLQHEATVDSLTGLPNRREVEQALAVQLQRAERDGTPLAVLLFDVDDFKRVNDTHGHQVGDEVLRAIGQALTSSLRGEDLAGRWGGEEFLALLPGTDKPGAVTVAEKLAARIGATTNSARVAVRVSIGLAVAPHHGTSLALLVQRADEALYAAKRAGKNCVRCYGDLGAEGASDPTRTQRLPLIRSSPEPQPQAWLRSDLRTPIPLRAGTAISLGRSDACDVILSFRTVSRLHAVIRVNSDGGMILTDASSNGVRINDELLQGGAGELSVGDQIGIGPYLLEVTGERGTSGDETQPI